MSQIISIELARAGMRLAEDLKSPQGEALAPRGTAVGDALLALAREAGVSELRVEVVGFPAGSDDGGAQRRLEHLFRRAGNDALTQALLRVMLEYRQERPQ